ncbi:hypothetical protein EV138_5630 [Kribbella voronezhensis]|uniref:Uncharacterized protein n=1 Tax=Kribbella voronezhensis TaxID=2512212 RepID=A0A4R7SWE2_9ACTN|nr:hypothetical protein EV138_5630 [Kribbella voronezhensis]
MTQYRLLMRREVLQQLAALSIAAKTQPGGLREREFRALKAGLRAIANGEEEGFDGKRLGYSPDHHDLRDCAEIKLPVVNETRSNRELGPSHRLLYREFEPEDGGPPYREVISFSHRGGDRPFKEAAARLGRGLGVRLPSLDGVSGLRPRFGSRGPGGTAPVRLPLPPDMRTALAASSGLAPARGAVNAPRHDTSPRAPTGRNSPLGPEPHR